MISAETFSKKQLVFVFMNKGEKLSFRNDNLIVKDSSGKIRFQTTCFKVFSLFVIGNFSITTGLIARAKRYCFSILLLNSSLRAYGAFGFQAEGNTQLRAKQYLYEGIGIAKKLVSNKIESQALTLKRQRYRGDIVNEAIRALMHYKAEVSSATSLQELMGIEGSAARVYFPAHFNNCCWTRRVPRAKPDYINATLDIGYTLLFNYVENMLRLYGFDLYRGVMHREFYQRKSLVCDLVEPFRPLMDWQIRKAISLGQCKEEHFDIRNGAYTLSWEQNKDYVLFLHQPLLKNKDAIFKYIQSYYRAFAQGKPSSEYPWFEMDMK